MRHSPAAETAAHPSGLPLAAFDQLRAGVAADRSQFLKDLSLPFYGYSRPGARVSEGLRGSFWRQAMPAGTTHKDRVNADLLAFLRA